MEITIDVNYEYDRIAKKFISATYGDYNAVMSNNEAQIIRRALEYYTEKKKLDFRERMDAGRMADEIRDAKEVRIEHGKEEA